MEDLLPMLPGMAVDTGTYELPPPFVFEPNRGGAVAVLMQLLAKVREIMPFDLTIFAGGSLSSSKDSAN